MLKVVLLFCRALCYDNNIVFGFSLFLMWKSLKSHFTLNWTYGLWRHCLINETIYYLHERSFCYVFLFFYHFKITIFISPSKHENIFLNKFTKTRILKWLFPNLLFLPKHQNPFQNFLQNSIISNCFSIKLPQEYLPYQCESRWRSRKSFHKPTWPSENLSLSDVPEKTWSPNLL